VTAGRQKCGGVVRPATFTISFQGNGNGSRRKRVLSHTFTNYPISLFPTSCLVPPLASNKQFMFPPFVLHAPPITSLLIIIIIIIFLHPTSPPVAHTGQFSPRPSVFLNLLRDIWWATLHGCSTRQEGLWPYTATQIRTADKHTNTCMHRWDSNLRFHFVSHLLCRAVTVSDP
jgi:hypothetical protein